MKKLTVIALVLAAISFSILPGCTDDSGAGPIRNTKEAAPGTDPSAQPPAKGSEAAPKTSRVSIPGQQNNGR
jgi:hypothetical protein